MEAHRTSYNNLLTRWVSNILVISMGHSLTGFNMKILNDGMSHTNLDGVIGADLRNAFNVPAKYLKD